MSYTIAPYPPPLLLPPLQGVRFWTDYLKAELGRRTVYTLPGVWQAANGSFAGFGEGAAAAGMMR